MAVTWVLPVGSGGGEWAGLWKTPQRPGFPISRHLSLINTEAWAPLASPVSDTLAII